MATRCYLSCTLTQELVDGHCLIVPIQHHLTMLEGDDDLWDEVRVRVIPLHNIPFFFRTLPFSLSLFGDAILV